MRARICHFMHWDYFTYEKQPTDFLETLVILMNEAEASKQQEHGG